MPFPNEISLLEKLIFRRLKHVFAGGQIFHLYLKTCENRHLLLAAQAPSAKMIFARGNSNLSRHYNSPARENNLADQKKKSPTSPTLPPGCTLAIITNYKFFIHSTKSIHQHKSNGFKSRTPTCILTSINVETTTENIIIIVAAPCQANQGVVVAAPPPVANLPAALYCCSHHHRPPPSGRTLEEEGGREGSASPLLPPPSALQRDLRGRGRNGAGEGCAATALPGGILPGSE